MGRRSDKSVGMSVIMSGKRAVTRAKADAPTSVSTTVNSVVMTAKRGVSRPTVPTAPTPEVRGPRTPRTLVSVPPRRPATSVTLSRPVPSRVESVWDWGWLVRPERVELAD